MQKIDLKDLLEAGVHFGHKASRWSPKMRPFIWGSKNRIHLIDVAKTAFLLQRAGKFLHDTAANGKSVLWVGTKKPAQNPIETTAKSLKMPFVINRWIGGTLTNFNQVKKAITRLLHFRDIIKKPSAHYKKKELSILQKEVDRLEKNIGGILDLEYPPGAVVIIDAKKERSAIKEAINSHVPIISLVDTNTDPSGINFIVPANDDSPRSISFVVEYLGKCVEDGKKVYAENKKAEKAAAEAKKSAAKTTKKATPLKKETPKKDTVVKKTAKPETKEVKKELKTETKKVEPTKEAPKQPVKKVSSKNK